jgi:hypothetical protein
LNKIDLDDGFFAEAAITEAIFFADNDFDLEDDAEDDFSFIIFNILL